MPNTRLCIPASSSQHAKCLSKQKYNYIYIKISLTSINIYSTLSVKATLDEPNVLLEENKSAYFSISKAT